MKDSPGEQEAVERGEQIMVTSYYDHDDRDFKVSIGFGDSHYRLRLVGAKQLRDALTAIIAETEQFETRMN